MINGLLKRNQIKVRKILLSFYFLDGVLSIFENGIAELPIQ
jgi:hypothetical protein